MFVRNLIIINNKIFKSVFIAKNLSLWGSGIRKTKIILNVNIFIQNVLKIISSLLHSLFYDLLGLRE